MKIRASFLISLVICSSLLGEDIYKDINEFGNELSVGGALKENAREKPNFIEYSLQEWYDAKKEIKEE